MTAACYQEIFRRHAHPLAPQPTDVEPVLGELAGIRAVLFDIYGTLLISGSGEVGVCSESLQGRAMGEALLAVGLRLAGDAGAAADCLRGVILRDHEHARRQGVAHPEVDMDDVWRRVLHELVGSGLAAGDPAEVDCRALSVHYEARANPAWPMPGLGECLSELRRTGRVLGLVSNAQFFTPELFPALLGRDLDELGLDGQLRFYSYRHGQAKPGLCLYQLAADALADRGVAAAEVLYVGNDMLNDIAAAGSVGFHTALFAGDARSLRLRADDPRVAVVKPDLVITQLVSLPSCLAPLGGGTAG